MAKHIHIHLAKRASTRDADEKWITINGTHVMIGGDGKITKGPKAFVGKTTAEAAGAKPDHKHDGTPKVHGPDPSKVGADVNERHNDLVSQGFKHEKTVGNPDDIGGQRRHYGHPIGSRAVITHKEEALGVYGQTPSHSVSSLVNSMNAGKAPTKAELTKRAKEAYAAANQGKGSYAKAAELFDAAGNKDAADSARALAKRYGHDAEGVARKKKADADAAATARVHAKQAANSKARALLLEKADLHEKRSKGDPEDNATSARLRALNDELAHAEKDDYKGGGDMDQARAAIRKEKPDIGIDDLNAEVEKRVPHKPAAGEKHLPFNAGKNDPVYGGSGRSHESTGLSDGDKIDPSHRFNAGKDDPVQKDLKNPLHTSARELMLQTRINNLKGKDDYASKQALKKWSEELSRERRRQKK